MTEAVSSLPVTIDLGRQQTLLAKADRFLARYYHPKELDLLLEQALVSFSFDDIPDNAALEGAPILERHGTRGTFYVAGGLAGRTFRHDRFADAGQIARLVESGHDVACHTYHHPNSQCLSGDDLKQEYAQNSAFLTKDCRAKAPRHHAYPYGSVGLVQKRAASHCFSAARGTRPGLNHGRIDLMQLFAVPLYDHLYDDKAVMGWIAEAVQKKAWLIFYSHDVAPVPSDQGTSSRLLDFAVERALDAGCDVKTVAEALDMVLNKTG